MEFKEITFTDENARRLYKDYISRARNAVKGLNKENQNETILEINSHIYEALLDSDKNEMESLLDIFENLGHPEVFLKELVAEKKLEEAARTFNPIKIFKALLLNLTNGASYIVFFVLYLSLFSFVFLIFAKLFDSENVGLFYKENDFFVLGKTGGIPAEHQQYEMLGNWFIPIMIAVAVLLFVLITLLLKLKKQLNKK